MEIEKTDTIHEVLKEEDIDLEDSEPQNKKSSPSSSSSPSFKQSSKSQSSNSRSESSNIRSECCKACLKESRNNGRACICQVPSSRRRTPLSAEGCITCNCHGCHPEDRDLDKEKPKISNSSSSSSSNSKSGNSSSNSNPHSSSSHSSNRENLKNGCCRACMKAFSENKKACLCQVPIFVRQSVLPAEGCTICKCKGCHPEEVLYRKKGGNWSSQDNNHSLHNMGNSSNVGYAMYGYYPPYFPYIGHPYGPSSDHYGHHGNSRYSRYDRYDDWYYDRVRSPERYHKHRRLDEPLSRKREREDSHSGWSHQSHDPERRSSKSHHRPRSRSSSPKRSRT